jgi:hypothetical protein
VDLAHPGLSASMTGASGCGGTWCQRAVAAGRPTSVGMAAGCSVWRVAEPTTATARAVGCASRGGNGGAVAAGAADGSWPLSCTGLRRHGESFVPLRPMMATLLSAIFFLGSVHRMTLSPLRSMSFLGENLDLLVRRRLRRWCHVPPWRCRFGSSRSVESSTLLQKIFREAFWNFFGGGQH